MAFTYSNFQPLKQSPTPLLIFTRKKIEWRVPFLAPIGGNGRVVALITLQAIELQTFR